MSNAQSAHRVEVKTWKRSPVLVARYVTAAVISIILGACEQRTEPAADAVTTTPSSSSTPTVAAAPQPSQLDLAANFEMSVNTVFRATTPEELTKLRPFQQVRLGSTPNGLKLIPEGVDAAILLPPFAEGKQFILKIALESPADETAIWILYLQGKQTQFDGSRSQIAPLKKGKNVAYFQLNQADLIDPVRVDFTGNKGDYLIEGIEARSLAKP